MLAYRAPQHLVFVFINRRGNVGRIALDAAAELESRASNSWASVTNIDMLSDRLRSMFPAAGTALLPADSIGLVCDIIEKWDNRSTTTNDDRQPNAIELREVSQSITQCSDPRLR